MLHQRVSGAPRVQPLQVVVVLVQLLLRLVVVVAIDPPTVILTFITMITYQDQPNNVLFGLARMKRKWRDCTTQAEVFQK